MEASVQIRTDGLESLLECSICLDEYKYPRELDCQHTFCGSPCLQRLVDHVTDTITCPVCRNVQHLHSTGIDGLRDNRTIGKLIELKSQCTQPKCDVAGSPIRDQCSVCYRREVVNELCFHCEKRLCPSCIRRHTVVMEDDVRELKQHVEQTARDVIKVSDRSKALHVTEKDVNILRSLLQTSTSLMVERLKQRQQILEQKLLNFMETEKVALTKLSERRKMAADALTLCNGHIGRDDPNNLNTQTQLRIISDKLKQSLVDMNMKEITLHDITADFTSVEQLKSLSEFGSITITNRDSENDEGDQPILEDNNIDGQQNEICTVSEEDIFEMSINMQADNKIDWAGKSDARDSDACFVTDKPKKKLINTHYIGAVFGVAVDPLTGVIAAADNHLHNIQLFDKHGRVIRAFGSYGSNHDQLDMPYGVDFTSDGNLLVTDGKNHRVKCYDLYGTVLYCWGRLGTAAGQFVDPLGICVDRKSGFVYVCDSGNKRIQRFHENGKTAPVDWLDAMRFERPTQIHVDRTGNLFVRDRSALKFFPKSAGYVQQPFSLLPYTGKGIHKGISSTLDGGLCLAHSDNCVYVYNNRQKLIKKIICRTVRSHFSYITDIAATADGAVIVAGKSCLELY